MSPLNSFSLKWIKWRGRLDGCIVSHLQIRKMNLSPPQEGKGIIRSPHPFITIFNIWFCPLLSVRVVSFLVRIRGGAGQLNTQKYSTCGISRGIISTWNNIYHVSSDSQFSKSPCNAYSNLSTQSLHEVVRPCFNSSFFMVKETKAQKVNIFSKPLIKWGNQDWKPGSSDIQCSLYPSTSLWLLEVSGRILFHRQHEMLVMACFYPQCHHSGSCHCHFDLNLHNSFLQASLPPPLLPPVHIPAVLCCSQPDLPEAIFPVLSNKHVYKVHARTLVAIVSAGIKHTQN